MSTDQTFVEHGSTGSALAAFQRGFVPIPIRAAAKRPHENAWQHRRWASSAEVREHFDRWAKEGVTNVGLLLGEPSNNLVDIDLDHAKALRLRDVMPHTAMVSGHVGRPRSHLWYRVVEGLPATRKYTMPDGSTIIEIRSTGAQTVIPPSVHPSKETYRWEGEDWGGIDGPADISGPQLIVQVGTLALLAVLTDGWPITGERHDAYLALAGGVLRFGDDVHPWWERNLPKMIEALAYVTQDRDGPVARVHEVMGSTVTKLRDPNPDVRVTGWPTLARIIGDGHVERVRRIISDIEDAAGVVGRPTVSTSAATTSATTILGEDIPEVDRSPMELRTDFWEIVPFDRYMSGEIKQAEPSMLRRTDGQALIYPGKVNTIFGKSESAKSWIVLGGICIPEMADDGRVVYLDLEDEPTGTADRLQRLGVTMDDLKGRWAYIHPESPLSNMQRYEGRGDRTTEPARASAVLLEGQLATFNPTLIVVDGLTSLYGLHGLSTNDAGATDVIGTWLKSLTRYGRTAVVIIDHTGKDGEDQIGAHHKMAVVQGSKIKVKVLNQPMPGELGEMALILYKDRPGAVRKASAKGRQYPEAGHVFLDSREEDPPRSPLTKLWIEPPAMPKAGEVVIDAGDDDGRMDAQLRRAAAEAAKHSAQGALDDAVLALFTDDAPEQMTKDLPDLLAATGRSATPKAIRESWQRLVEADYLERVLGTSGKGQRVRRPR